MRRGTQPVGQGRGSHPPVLRKPFFEPFLLTNPDGSTQGMVTGYYEPLLRGSRTRRQVRSPGAGRSPNLLTIDLRTCCKPQEHALARPPGRQPRRALSLARRDRERGLEKAFPERVLLWVDDAVRLFFLQVQGSGRVKLPGRPLHRAVQLRRPERASLQGDRPGSGRPWRTRSSRSRCRTFRAGPGPIPRA